MIQLKRAFTFLLISSALISCKCIKGKKSDMVVNLENTTWNLVKTKEKVFTKNSELPNGISISFNEGNFSSNDGCNSLGGEYIVTENTIAFDKIRGTKRYCDPEYMEKNGYPISFYLVKKYEIKGDKLFLLEEDGKSIVAEYIMK